MIKGHNSLIAVEVLWTYRHRSGPQEVQVRVLPKQVTFWMGGIKLLPTHDEMAGKVTSCKTNRWFKCLLLIENQQGFKTQQIIGGERL